MPVIEDISLIALDGERTYENLPRTREVAIRVKVSVLDSSEEEGPQEEDRAAIILATLFLEVFGADGAEGDVHGAEAEAREPSGQGDDPPIFSGRVVFRIDGRRPPGDDPRWVPAVFAEAWPYLRSQVITHAQLLGMGKIPVPLKAPENLTREPLTSAE